MYHVCSGVLLCQHAVLCVLGLDVDLWPQRQSFTLTVKKDTVQSPHLALRAVYKFKLCDCDGASAATKVTIPGSHAFGGCIVSAMHE